MPRGCATAWCCSAGAVSRGGAHCPNCAPSPVWPTRRARGSRRSFLRSRRFRWLVAKEFRELVASRAFWLLLLMIGPLVGHGFITAVDTYADASRIGCGPAALAQGLSPLDGVLVPTVRGYDLARTPLFPLLAIRPVATEKASGAWK